MLARAREVRIVSFIFAVRAFVENNSNVFKKRYYRECMGDVG